MKTIATAALLTAIGSGAALAQGAPPGFAPWQSGWHGAIAVPQAQILGTVMTRPDTRTTLTRIASREPARDRAVN
jgi:hypothetical protein